MTYEKVSDSASVLQHSSALSSQPQFGRRAFGRQRRMSQETLVRNIVESIITHRQLGQNRDASFYTPDSETQAQVKAQLDALVMAVDEAVQDMLNPPGLFGFA